MKRKCDNMTYKYDIFVSIGNIVTLLSAELVKFMFRQSLLKMHLESSCRYLPCDSPYEPKYFSDDQK